VAISNVVRIVLGGHLPGGEVFQTSWWYQDTSAPAVDDSTAAAMAAGTETVAFLNAAKALINGSAGYDTLDQYGYDSLPGPATSHGHAALSSVGSSSLACPNQVSVVMTLRSATAGRQGRGRMYLPANGATMASLGLLATTQVDACVDTLAAWLGSFTSGVTPAIVSRTGAQTHPIISVDADYVADTQRRRTNKLISARHSASV
jgi:hypothetical protein